MRDRRDVRRCEALTRKGGRCKSKAMVYHQHQDGAEYLACLLRHRNAEFRPATVARPPVKPLILSPPPRCWQQTNPSLH